MSEHQGGERYRLQLEAARDNAPPQIRLRAALKCLLRTFGLRCRSVEALITQMPGQPPVPAAPHAGQLSPPGRSEAEPGQDAANAGCDARHSPDNAVKK
jgi:hypothetical protein